MAESFRAFIARLFKAIKNGDVAVLRTVYLDWFESSAVMPDRSFDDFIAAALPDLGRLPENRLVREECFDDFCIAHFKGKDGSDMTLTFRKKGDSFIFFNERSGFAAFKKVYALNYVLDGGKLRMLFNGKRSPIVHEVESFGFVTFINSALKVGANEITLEPVDAGASVKASIRISSGPEGDIMESAAGDVLSWDGEVGKAVSLKFDAE